MLDELDLCSLAARAGVRRADARQRLYETFRSYRLSEYGTTDSTCPHCMTGEEFEQIAATPLAQIRTAEPEELMAAALDRGLADDAAIAIATALSNIALLTTVG